MTKPKLATLMLDGWMGRLDQAAARVAPGQRAVHLGLELRHGLG